MKTMKYRSILATLTIVALSVFLFTSCEKESGSPDSSKVDRLEKFKRLQFTASSTSSSTNSGSGTFIGSGNSISFVSNDGPKTNFAPVSSGSSNGFTDPKSSGSSFIVDQSFGFGGGTVNLDGKDIELDFAFCADTDFFGSAGASGDTTKELNVFIGISGDFVNASEGTDALDLILYVFSYNGGTEIGNFADFGEGDFDKGAFVIAAKNEDDGKGQGGKKLVLYFATGGSAIFDNGSVLLSTVELLKIEEDDDGIKALSSKTSSLDAQLECATYEEEKSK